MTKTRIMLRIGLSIAIIGLAIFFSNLTSSLMSSDMYASISIPSNGADNLVQYFSNRSYEIRIVVPENFNGTLYVFNYEGIKNLIKGFKTPLMETNINGSVLIDFTPNRRGPYMILIENKTSKRAEGALNIIEKEAVNQDLIGDSLMIILCGLAITTVTLIIKHRKIGCFKGD
ncbi:MAG: hypothetical protein QXZ25_03140 [Candidatus Bathyarchaeia archaeon]